MGGALEVAPGLWSKQKGELEGLVLVTNLTELEAPIECGQCLAELVEVAVRTTACRKCCAFETTADDPEDTHQKCKTCRVLQFRPGT